MTELVLERVASLLQRARLQRSVGELPGQPESVLTVQICFSGGDERTMRDWLGRRWSYRAQGEGDLAVRMSRALEGTFAFGAHRGLLLRDHCPEICVSDLEQAFAALGHRDVVLGRSSDGGCYLVGLRREAWDDAGPTLLRAADSSSPMSCDEVARRARAAGLSVALARTLTAVNRPEALDAWERARRASGESPHAMAPARISAVVPARADEVSFRRTLTALGAGRDVEIIVVHGSQDAAGSESARERGARVVNGGPGRSEQLNRGAAAAAGATLLFPVGAAPLSAGFDATIRDALRDPQVVGGGFAPAAAAGASGAQLALRAALWNARLLNFPAGTSSAFVRAGEFRALGGFDERSASCDVDLLWRLRDRGRVVSVTASPTPYTPVLRPAAFLRSTLVADAVVAGHFVGVERDRLLGWCQRVLGPRNQGR